MAERSERGLLERLRQTARGFWLLVSLAFRADPWRAALIVIPITTITSATISLGMRGLVDAVAGDHRRTATTWVIVLAAAGAVTVMLLLARFTIDMRLREHLSLEVDQRLISLCSGVPTVEHLERADYADRVELLRTNRYVLMSGVSALAYGLVAVTELAVTVSLLVWIHPSTLFAVVLAVPAVAIAIVSQRRVEKVYEQTTEDERRALHLFDLAAADDAAKELRVFGLEDELRSRYDDLWRGVERKRTRADAIASALRGVGFMFFVAGFVGALGSVAGAAAEGRVTVGDLFLAVVLTSNLTSQLQSAAGQAVWMTTMLRNAARFLWIVDYGREVDTGARAAGSGTASAPSRLNEGIRLDRVSFRYGDAERAALADVDVVLPAGAIVAVVGDNGAGKTTLVKLLGGLYWPTEGTVTVDGVDLRHIATDDWRGRISAGFQDHTRFELIAHEVVGVGDVPRLGDIGAADHALDRAAGRDVLRALEEGWQTPLGSTLDGADLSGGQWQKLALARAMVRTNPLLLILDEPTSALDAETEFALFERYADAARTAGKETGTVTLLVSHRFSTVRIADLILVMEGGRVIEQGTHAELMAMGGTYAELYTMQASAYA